jgi:hypothetical protein
MAVTITKIDKITNVAATLQTGGSLLPNTTYYVRVTGRNQNFNLYCFAGYLTTPPSDEISFTTTETERSVALTWDGITSVYGAAAVRYNVY